MTAGVVYDTGALVAAERRDRAMWHRHAEYLVRERAPTVPVGVLAQAWRGGPQAELSRCLRGCRVTPLDEATAREAGRALMLSGVSDVIDAVVVVLAVRHGDVVLTSDPDDLERIAAALGANLPTIVV